MKTDEIVYQLEKCHDREVNERRKGGWGVPDPVAWEDSAYGAAATRLEELQKRVDELEASIKEAVDFCKEHPHNWSDAMNDLETLIAKGKK